MSSGCQRRPSAPDWRSAERERRRLVRKRLVGAVVDRQHAAGAPGLSGTVDRPREAAVVDANAEVAALAEGDAGADAADLAAGDDRVAGVERTEVLDLHATALHAADDRALELQHDQAAAALDRERAVPGVCGQPDGYRERREQRSEEQCPLHMT